MMHHDAIEKHVNKRLEYSSAGRKIGQKLVHMNVILRGDVTKREKKDNGSTWFLLPIS